MKRSDYDDMTLEELYRRAAERDVREAPGLPREAVIARLLELDTAVETPSAPAKPTLPVAEAAAPMGPATPPRAPSAHGPGMTSPTADKAHGPGLTSPTAHGARAASRGAGIPSAVAPDRPAEQDPEAMARLYLDQGEYERAIEIYHELLALRPDDEALAAGLATAEGHLREIGAFSPGGVDVEPPATPHRFPDEPTSMLDLEEAPELYGIDECELIAQNPHWLFVYWEATDRGLAAARADLGDEAGAARLTLRLFATAGPGERGPEREVRDHALDWNHGRKYVQPPRPGVRVRAAVGLLTPSGLFAPIAQSTQVRVPPADAAPQLAADWMEVAPPRSAGREYEPVQIIERGPGNGERGLVPPPPHGARTDRPRHAEAAHEGAEGPGTFDPPGSSPTGGPPAGTSAPSSPSSPWRWRPGSGS